jgi:hypothetical protein
MATPGVNASAANTPKVDMSNFKNMKKYLLAQSAAQSRGKK